MAERAPDRGSEASADDRPGLGPMIVGVLAANVAFAAVFNGPRDRFWSRMTATGLGLGSWALLTSRPSRGIGIGPGRLLAGLASAVGLYLTFKVGDRFARSHVPGGDAQIREIYALRTLRPRAEIATRLALIVGPAEEIFWRGLVQSALMRRYGRWRGSVLAALAYAGVHVTTGNFTLFGAAGVAGAHWCVLYAARVPLGSLIVSHVAWDVWIFLVQPTGETDAIGPDGRVVRLRTAETLR